MNLYIVSIYLFLVATLHSKLEIMIECDETGGWAKKLPCWRFNCYIIKLIIGKEITGYHTYMLILFLTLFHGLFLVDNWTLKKEFFVLGCFCIYWCIEDIMWFVQNKHYGLKKFRKGHISWHNRWFFYLPVSYWTSIIIGGILIYLGLS
jgi:hypothetical protein